MICKQCYTVYGKFRSHCPTCGCARLVYGKLIDTSNMQLIGKRKHYRCVAKFNAKVSAR